MVSIDLTAPLRIGDGIGSGAGYRRDRESMFIGKKMVNAAEQVRRLNYPGG